MQYTRRNITRFLTGLGMMMFIIPHLTAATVLPTATPIKHVIIIVGENHSFDSLFATYVPVHGQKVHNLLSQGIIKYDGTPGSHYAKAMQMQATVHQKFSISPAAAVAGKQRGSKVPCSDAQRPFSNHQIRALCLWQ